MKTLAVALLACPLFAQSFGDLRSVLHSPQQAAAPAYGAWPPRNLAMSGVAERFPMDPSRKGVVLYRWSVAAVVAANVLDATSSWRKPEANPFLGGRGTNFGPRALAIKAGLGGASLLVEHIALRRNPKLHRKLAWLNFTIAGGLGVAATYNFRLH